jgi:hypothetical protein
MWDFQQGPSHCKPTWQNLTQPTKYHTTTQPHIKSTFSEVGYYYQRFIWSLCFQMGAITLMKALCCNF